MVVDGAVLEEPADTTTPPDDDHSRDVYTLANIITVLRLILVPIFFTVLVSGRNDVISFILFAVAASTDWLDGQIARRTGTVTEIGKAIDPLVDRLLIAFGVLGVYLQGRVPLWVVLTLLFRDLYLLAGASYLARSRVRALPVVFLGKLTTALLLIGFSDLILNWPQVPGLGLIDSPALPGFGGASAAAGIWFVYAGVITSLLTAGFYTVLAARALSRSQSKSAL